MSETRTPWLKALAFAAPALPIAWLVPPVYAILGDFYLRHTAATAAGLGTAMIISKLVDAFTDLPVGYLSDNTRSPFGPRKPWLIGGALLAILSFAMLFMPPKGAGDIYFTSNIILYYLAITFIFIPYRAWLGEIAPGYRERTRLWSFVTIGMLVGGMAFVTLPVILSLPAIGILESPEFGPQAMEILGWVGIVAMPLCMLPALAMVPSGVRNPGQPPRLKSYWEIITQSQPYRLFLVGYGMAAMGFGIFYSVIIVALTSHYGLADEVAIFLVLVTLAQVLSIPFWEKGAAKFSKHRTWAFAWFAHACVGPLLLLIDPRAAPFWPIVALGMVNSILQAPHMLFPVAVVNDIVDYDTMKTGNSRSGTFMAFYTFFSKVLQAVGFGIGYYTIAWFGYDPKADSHTSTEIAGLMLAVAGLPSLCFLISAALLYRFPIDARRHATIRKRIAIIALRTS